MTPNTTVTLFATPFDATNKYVVKAESEAEAFSIVSSFPSKEFTNCYWQRNYSAFRANGNINEISRYNYCVFENNGKKNFAFITSLEYHNDAYTDVNIQLDFWLNYAGQYTFQPSPMRRCHPEQDRYYESMEGEPIDIAAYVPNEVYNSNTPTGYTDEFVHVITTVNALTFRDQPVDYWDAFAKMFLGEGNQFGTLLNELKMTPCNCDGIIQGNTSICDSEKLSMLVESFEKAGRTDCIVTAYRVPTAARIMGLNAFDYADLPGRLDSFNISRGFTSVITYWNKIKYSPQFNHITINLGGNIKEYSTAIAGVTNDQLQFVAYSNQSENGCTRINCIDYKNANEGVVFSPSWDKVQIAGVGSERAAFIKSMVNLIPGISTVSRTMQNYQPLKNRGNFHDVVGAIGDLISEGMAIPTQVQGQGYLIGNNAENLTSFCLRNPLYTCAWYIPMDSDLERINNMFCTYGYSYDGEVKPITFPMPIWSYYQTQEAVITGNTVPQEAIARCISRFNAGIFVFNNVSQYKNFSLSALNHY